MPPSCILLCCLPLKSRYLAILFGFTRECDDISCGSRTNPRGRSRSDARHSVVRPRVLNRFTLTITRIALTLFSLDNRKVSTAGVSWDYGGAVLFTPVCGTAASRLSRNGSFHLAHAPPAIVGRYPNICVCLFVFCCEIVVGQKQSWRLNSYC